MFDLYSTKYTIKYEPIPCKMEIGEKISSQKLTELGWEKIKALAGNSCEIWSKESQKIIWRIKNESVYLIWTSNNSTSNNSKR